MLYNVKSIIKKLGKLSIVFCLLFITKLIAAPIVSVSSSTSQVNIGDNFFIDLAIQFDMNDILSAYDLDLSFDNTNFEFVGGSFNDPGLLFNPLDLPEAGSFGFFGEFFDGGLGIVDIFGVSGNSDSALESDQPALFTFARFEFTSLSAVTSAIFEIDETDLFLSLAGANFSELPGVVFDQNANVTVNSNTATPVPSPGSIGLFAIGFLTLLSMRAKKHSQKS